MSNSARAKRERPRDTRRRRRAFGAALLATWALSVLALGCSTGSGGDRDSARPVSSETTVTADGGRTQARPALPVGHDGRWLTDANGRVLLLHGQNFVAKTPGQTFETMGFDAGDIEFIKANGFDMLRLGLSPDSLMPTPGVIDQTYLDVFVRTAKHATAAGLLVLVDLHQDGWGPGACGPNGFPAWMTIVDQPLNCQPDPLYYLNNAAPRQAFQSFWDNRPGPDGVGLTDQVATMFKALAERLGDDPGILGYDILNEPFPGATWLPCVAAAEGCPDIEHTTLDPFHTRAAAAIRSADRTHLVFGEPFVLFNLGRSATHIEVPGNDPNGGMAFHLYPIDAAGETNNPAQAVAWSQRTGGALIAGEWGASTNAELIERQASILDSSLIPWIWWAYETRWHDDPAGGAQLDAMVRPHPIAVAGTPQASSYDTATRTLRFTASTRSPKGNSYAAGTVSSFSIPARTYPTGATVTVDGGTLVEQNDGLATVTANRDAAQITVTISPATTPGTTQSK